MEEKRIMIEAIQNMLLMFDFSESELALIAEKAEEILNKSND